MTPHELFGPAARRDQFPVYAALRGNGPVQVGPTRWALLDHKDVRAALADPGAFSSDLSSQDNPVFANSPLIFDDPPQHTRIRKLVGQAFTARQVALVSPWLSTLAATLFDTMGAGPVDVIGEYCDPFPTRAIARLLGVPSAAHGLLKQWSLDRTYVAYHGNRDARRTPPSTRPSADVPSSRRTSSISWPSAAPGRKKISSLRWLPPRWKGPRSPTKR